MFWAPFHLRFFRRISNSMEISFHSHLESYRMIATKCCTWHDSCAVVACAKICCDLMASNGIMARRSFRRIWIAGKKNVSETGPWCTLHKNANRITLAYVTIPLCELPSNTEWHSGIVEIPCSTHFFIYWTLGNVTNHVWLSNTLLFENFIGWIVHSVIDDQINYAYSKRNCTPRIENHLCKFQRVS